MRVMQSMVADNKNRAKTLNKVLGGKCRGKCRQIKGQIRFKNEVNSEKKEIFEIQLKYKKSKNAVINVVKKQPKWRSKCQKKLNSV